ncbi:MAG: TIGR02444 family protein [Defluviicoccus sp.]|nr:TIGR02444 family protein [Defluviicoccus sp.]MDE0386600.1 TIGR02444 family protein [Defluviicoccus sp.]
MAADFPDHPFWDFSLRVYGSDGVPEACLALQERHQIDVNVMLYCCWLGASGRGALDGSEIALVCETVGDWHRDIVRGVRAVRQRLKGGLGAAPLALSEPLRRRIAKIEVDLEHVEQLMLAESLAREPDEGLDAARRLADAIDNVGAYFAAAGIAPDEADATETATVLGPAFAGLRGKAVARAAHSRLAG